MAVRAARKIARALGARPRRSSRANKPLYHAASALAAGHALVVVEAAVQLLMSLGMKRREAVRALLPMTRQVLQNYERLGPRAAWTGPLARGDYEVVAKHLNVLQEYFAGVRKRLRSAKSFGRAGLRLDAADTSPAGVGKVAKDQQNQSANDRGQRVNRLQIAMESTTLPNGLKVVIAPDSSAPVVTVGVYYKIGFRLEPQGRSGFAHLFEHMMFQGSANAAKDAAHQADQFQRRPAERLHALRRHQLLRVRVHRTRSIASCGSKPTACAPSKWTTKICATSATSSKKKSASTS